MATQLTAGDKVQYCDFGTWRDGYTVVEVLRRDYASDFGGPRVVLREEAMSTDHSEHQIETPVTNVRLS